MATFHETSMESAPAPQIGTESQLGKGAPLQQGQNSRQCTAAAGTTASCARAPRTSSCLGRSGSPRTQFAHRPGSGGSGFGVGALRPPAPGCSTTLGASATPRAVGEGWQGQGGPQGSWPARLLAALPPLLGSQSLASYAGRQGTRRFPSCGRSEEHPPSRQGHPLPEAAHLAPPGALRTSLLTSLLL